MLHLNELPPLLIAFVATALFGFVIGLELHSYRHAEGKDPTFGTTRTLTFLAVLGFIMAALDNSLQLFMAGFIVIALFIGLSFWNQLQNGERSLMASLIALMTYVIGPIALTQPIWLLVLYVVTILLLLGGKPGIRRFSDALRSSEAVTLSKFLIMAGLVLPMLPDRQISTFLQVTYYQVWLAVIIVSGISYLSYLAQTYFFASRGVLLTGLLGGLYSSTAVTVVLARQSKDLPYEDTGIGAAIVLATAMMYLRLWALILLLGHASTAWNLALPFGVVVVMLLIASRLLYRPSLASGGGQHPEAQVKHPLEFATALLFAGLFLFFSALTQYVTARFGMSGLHLLSFVVGFSDIDPFILSMLAGKLQLSNMAIEAAVIIASASNNLLKAIYALVLGRSRSMWPAAICLIAAFILPMIYALWAIQ